MAQQVAQQYAAPPPAKKERRDRSDRDLPDDDHYDMDNSDSDRLSSVHPDSDQPDRLGLESAQSDRGHMLKDRRQERLGLDKHQQLHVDSRPERAGLAQELLQHDGAQREIPHRELMDKLQPQRQHIDKDPPLAAGAGMQAAERMRAEKEVLKKGKLERTAVDKQKEKEKGLAPNKKPTAKKIK